MTKEYIFVCACDSCLVLQYIILIIFHILDAYHILDNKNMAYDKVFRSKTDRGPTRLKNMFKKINKDDKISLSIDIHTSVANGQHAKKYSE